MYTALSIGVPVGLSIPETLKGPNVQLLSTQTIGRYGTNDFEKVFYVRKH